MVTIYDKAVLRGRFERHGKLRIAQRPATWLIDHLTRGLAADGAGLDEPLERQIADFVHACLEVVAAAFRLTDEREARDRLTAATGALAGSGMPLDLLMSTLHEGMRQDLGAVIGDLAKVVATPEGEDGQTPTVVDVLAMLTAVICAAFVTEIRDIATAHDASGQALASALLAGRPHVAIANEFGIELHDAYFVLAFFYTPRDHPGTAGFDETIVARGRRIRIDAALTDRLGHAPLFTLGTRSGTILVPAEGGQHEIDAVVEVLAEFSSTPIVVTADLARTDELRAVAARMDELLRMVLKLGYGPGLYRMRDLALEYQLTRPGRGRDALAAYLDPLAAHPELETTLEHYIRTGLRRNRTAQLLRVHPNTVDNRLKRIMELVKPNHYDAVDLWQLRSAWIARTFRA